jgi:type I restriction enzyme S subunit
MSWPSTRLADLCTVITKGTTPTTLGFEFSDRGIKFLRVQNINGGTVNYEKDILFIDERTHQALARSQIQPGDVLLSIAGTIGRTGVVPEDAPALNCNQALAILRTNGSVFQPFLRHWLESSDAQRQMLGATVTGTISNLSLTQIGNFRIPLPPLPEQCRIAELLDLAELLRAKRQAALAQLETLTQAIFLDLFGDPSAQGWLMTTVAEMANQEDGSIRTGPFGSQLLHSEFVDEGVAVLGIDNAVANEFRWGERRFISQSKYRDLKRYTVRPSDVLITIMGTCGRCAVVPDDVPLSINTKHLCCITLDQNKCLPVFLHAYFLRHPIARRYLDQTAKGAIMSGLNMGIIEAMPIPIPPIDLQHKFARNIAATEKLKTAYRASLAEMDSLFAALQYRAFRVQS